MSVEETGSEPDTDRKPPGCCVNKVRPGYKERLGVYQPVALKDPLLTGIKGDILCLFVGSSFYVRSLLEQVNML